MADGSTHATGRLKSFVERIERLEEDKKGVTADLTDVYAEAKGEGFDTKVLRKVIKRRATDPAKLAEEEALIDLYEAHLGGRAPKTPREAPPSDPGLPFDAPSGEATEAAAEPPPVDTVEQARGKGREAAKSGQPVTTNPYPAGDPRRVAWDEAWCAETGTDGMDIPADLKPTKPKGDRK